MEESEAETHEVNLLFSKLKNRKKVSSLHDAEALSVFMLLFICGILVNLLI